ncbi:MAG: LysM peptidoglycan-binding domain-containing protein [Trueperaceae bacterium]
MPCLRGTVHACLLAVALSAPVALANPIVVKPGDNVWALARAHGTTAEALMAANGMESDYLVPGQELRLPETEEASVAPRDVVESTVPARTAAVDAATRNEAPSPTPAPTPAPSPAASPAQSPAAPASHVVVTGENLWSLARRYDTTVASLMSANGLTSDALRPGATLVVPTPGTDADAAVRATATHVVQPGDNLWVLARRYDTTVASLMAVNALTDSALRPGIELTVPSAAGSAPAVAAPAAAAPPAPAATVTVRAGDSLFEIGLAQGVSVDDLIAWNDLDGTLIKPGQVLALRQPANAPAAAPLVVHVASGDSLWTLARRHGTTVDALAASNGISTNGTLRVGQALTVPGQYAAVHATSGAAGADVGGAASAEIRVVPGDNLWKIARQHNTTVASLMALNGLPHDRLVVGQTLRVVPGPELGAVAAALAPTPSATVGMVWPLVGQITSRFGYRRLRISGTNMHYGLDIDGDIGDPLRSATSGTVTFSGWRGGFGNLVIVARGDTEYYYAHASALLVQEGQTVTAGQLIARVGATGNVTGPHLHFEIRVNGTAVDPLPILESRASR